MAKRREGESPKSTRTSSGLPISNPSSACCGFFQVPGCRVVYGAEHDLAVGPWIRDLAVEILPSQTSAGRHEAELMAHDQEGVACKK